MTIYRITLDNYHGETEIELYRNKANADKRLRELWCEAKRREELDWYDDDDKLHSFSFFDSSYNELSTYISYTECQLDDLFQD